MKSREDYFLKNKIRMVEKLEERAEEKITALLDDVNGEDIKNPQSFIVYDIRNRIKNLKDRNKLKHMSFDGIKKIRDDIHDRLDRLLKIKADYYIQVLEQRKYEPQDLFFMFGWLMENIEKNRVNLSKMGKDKEYLSTLFNPYIQ